MRFGLAVVCVLVAATALVVSAQDRGHRLVRPPGDLANELLAGSESSWRTREVLLKQLLAHYASVRDVVLREIRVARPSAPVRFGGKLHSALRVAGTWRIQEAESALARLVSCQLDVGTIPAGYDLAGSQLYPAAHALKSLSVKPEALFAKASDRDVPILTWVLAKNQGRENALALLRHHAKGGKGGPHLDRALQLLEGNTQIDDLLPPVLKGPR